MHTIDRFLASQLGRPRGVFGRLVMARILAYGNAALNTWTNELLDVRSDERMLDLGCGPGTALAASALQTTRGFTVGLDYAPAMVRLAHQTNRALIQQGRVGVLQGDAMALPFAEGCFTAVYAVNVIYFWPKPSLVLQEIYRVLGPGGRIVIATRPKERIEHLGFTQHGLQLYSDAELVALFTAAGFREVHSVRQPIQVGMGGLCTIGQRI